MVDREIIIKESVADSIADIAWYIESRGLVATAEKFADDAYDFLERLADKYTVVFLEADDELIICEFISSKNIHW